jgi:hypothetical protein
MMKRITVLTVSVMVLLTSTSVFARGAARDLRRIIGYTIVMADTVQKVFEKDGDKFSEQGKAF